MPRRLIKLTLTLALILTITNLAARALGSLQPANPALRGFTEGCEDKPQPCWYGIVPGVTTFTEANSVLMRYGFEFGQNLRESRHLVAETCNVFFVPSSSGDVIANLTFTDCKSIRWGEMMRHFGTPDMLLICHDYIPPKPYYSYKSGLNVRIDDVFGGDYWATPFDHVSGFEMFLPTSVYTDDFEFRNPWLGFMPTWKYTQLNADLYNQYCYGEG